MVNSNNFQSTIHSTGCVIPSLFYFCFTIFLYSLRNCISFFEHTGATRQTASQRITKKRSNIPVVEKMITEKSSATARKSDEETISEFD